MTSEFSSSYDMPPAYTFLCAIVCRAAGTISSRASACSANYNVFAAASSLSHATAASHGTYARPSKSATAARFAHAKTAPCYVQQPSPSESACHVDVEPNATAANSYVASAPARHHDPASCRTTAVQRSCTVCINTPAFLPNPCGEPFIVPVPRVQQLRRQQ